MLKRLRRREEWQFAAVLPRADAWLAGLWWTLLIARGLLPALFAIAMGRLVGAVQAQADLALPLTSVGVVFVALQVLTPLHQAVGANLGFRTAAWLYDQLAVACMRPPGVAHLEDPGLTSDITMARDFDLGISGPPLSISMDFIASGLVELLAGLACAAVLAAYAWWAPFALGGAWLATHWLLRESGVWKDRNTEVVRNAQRHADYAYRLAVDAPSAKELRLFGLPAWTVERFRRHRRKLHDLRWQATRLRERPVLASVVVVTLANAAVFAAMAWDAQAGTLALDRMITFATAAFGVSAVAFGGLSWALDGAAAPAAAVLRLREPMAERGALARGSRSAAGLPAKEIRFRNVRFAYATTPDDAVLDGFDLAIPAGSSLAIVGQNGAGKTTLAKLLCRLYDPQAGGIEVDGVDLRELAIDAWRERVTAVFQDFVRYQWPLRDNVAPAGATDAVVQAALQEAGAADLAALDTVLARAYDGGTDLSGGQWQRVALARVLAAVHAGAGVVLLDEPTAQLDVRGEAEIFNRILQATRAIAYGHNMSPVTPTLTKKAPKTAFRPADQPSQRQNRHRKPLAGGHSTRQESLMRLPCQATRDTTTILISHRFSTVRHADRICVVERGRVAELGSHDELMARGGRYRTMFDLQAQRFAEEEGTAADA